MNPKKLCKIALEENGKIICNRNAKGNTCIYMTKVQHVSH